jgi:hypothetical protein
MPNIRVQVVRFVDEEPQPGIVECQFRDAQGQVHSILDKVPMFTEAVLWSDSEYPQSGSVECRMLGGVPVSGGNLSRIRTLGSTNGESEFLVSNADLSY